MRAQDPRCQRTQLVRRIWIRRIAVACARTLIGSSPLYTRTLAERGCATKQKAKIPLSSSRLGEVVRPTVLRSHSSTRLQTRKRLGSESDRACCPLSRKAAQAFLDVQHGVL